jgi:putative ABC transport system permease protein
MLTYNLRLAWKSILRHPVLTGLIVTGIALGVAVSTTFLTVYHVLSQDPIPGKSGRLFYVRLDSWGGNQPFSDDGAPPDHLTYRDMRGIVGSPIPVRQSPMFKANLYVHPEVVPEAKGQRPFRETVRLAMSDFFPMFNVPFRYGSGWSREADAKPEQVAVISSDLNDRLFGGANSVGRKIRIEDRDFTVSGVLDRWRPAVLFYDMTQNPNSEPEDVFLPFNLVEPMQIHTAGNIQGWRSDDRIDDFSASLQNSEMAWIQMWAQLDTPAQRQAYQSFLDNYANEQKRHGRFPHPLNNRITSVVDLMQEWKVVPPQARSLALISLLFLVVAALNLVGLFLGKFLARAPVAGVRRALGASRRMIFLQHLVECELVGLLGGACGLLLSLASLALVNHYYHPGGEGETFFHLDLPMVGAAVALSLAAAAIAGLYPAWRICAIPPANHLKSQ